MNLSLVALLAIFSSVQAADPKKVEYGKIETYKTKSIADHFKVDNKNVTEAVAKNIFNGINTILKDGKVSVNDKKKYILSGLSKALGDHLSDNSIDASLAKLIETNYPEITSKALGHFRTLMMEKDEPTRKSKTRAIRPEFIIAAGKAGMNNLQDYNHLQGNSILHFVKADYWKLLSTDMQLCANIDVSTIEKLEVDALKQFTPECFNQVQRIESLKGDKFVGKVSQLRDDLYSKYTGAVINKKVAAKLSANQVESFASALTVSEEERNCALLPLDSISLEAASKVHLTCLLKYLAGQVKLVDGRKTIDVKLQQRWSKFSPELYKQVKELTDANSIKLIATVINGEEHNHISSEKFVASLNAMLESEAFATTFAPLKAIKGLKVAPKTLAKIRNSALIQSVLLETVSLPDDILSYTSADFFKAISFEKNGKSISGLQILDLIKSDCPNLVTIVKNLGESTKGAENPWALIDNQSDFDGVKILAKVFPKKAVKNIQATTDRDVLFKNPNYLDGVKHSTLADMEVDYTKITKAQLKAILTGDFASRVSQETFMTIATDALAVVDGASANALLRRFSLPADRTVRFADDAFSFLDAESFAKLSLKHVNNEQYKHMNPSIIASLTAEQLKELAEKTAFLGAKQVAALSNDSLATLNIEKVTASALTNLNATQVKALTPLFGKLSEEQVKLIGSQSTTDKAAVLKVLKDEINKLSPKAVEALNIRLIAEKVADDKKGVVAESASGISTTTIILIASGVILLGGIGVFVIVKYVV